MTTARRARLRGAGTALGTAVAAVAVLGLGGCGGGAAPTGDAAVPFRQALRKADFAAACRLLTPATRAEVESSSGEECTAGLAEESLPASAGPPTSVESFGLMAEVVFDDDTVFLARDGDHWAVLAAGCTPRPVGPHECLVKGG